MVLLCNDCGVVPEHCICELWKIRPSIQQAKLSNEEMSKPEPEPEPVNSLFGNPVDKSVLVSSREEISDTLAGIEPQPGCSSEPDDEQLKECKDNQVGGEKLLVDGVDLRKCALPPDKKRELIRLINKYRDVFSKDGEPGVMTDVEFEIDTGEAPPFKEKCRYLSPEKFEVLRKAIDKMLKMGIIRRSKSPWASAVVLVPKDGGKGWRVCIDYRRLNSLTKADSYPLPKLDDLMTCYSQGELFSSLDLTAGYWHVPVKPSDIEKTAFICPLGLFECPFMPFGARNSGAVFQRVMDCILRGMQWRQYPTYVDNIGVWSKYGENHVKLIERLFHRLRIR